MSKICGYSCKHNKSGVCQTSVCDKQLIMSDKTEVQTFTRYIDTTTTELQQENKQLKDNWNKLKEWVNKHYDYYINNEDYIGGRLCFTDMKDKMQELEKSDSNE